MRDRFPSSVYGLGTEPDPRFSLANERTFLAWIRTSLALIAAAVALEALDVPIEPGFRLGASAILVVLGVMGATQAWVGWVRTERALREGRPLPGPSVGIILAAGLIVATVLMVVGYGR